MASTATFPVATTRYIIEAETEGAVSAEEIAASLPGTSKTHPGGDGYNGSGFYSASLVAPF
ncbi:uncharacterized protein N7459_005231 [Penicillium hispanicum]|uniref:uncharacterized protein n=1 Tax=Penicillium hispanicum TaxID=1080232 RepID=UPI00253FFD5A|nr:uncharacterized protein N7459_005231 [Penicillium hispanicum]KAJ5585431.1 hypothetical protein N7459_005231 [Penicillium hispanicum]